MTDQAPPGLILQCSGFRLRCRSRRTQCVLSIIFSPIRDLHLGRSFSPSKRGRLVPHPLPFRHLHAKPTPVKRSISGSRSIRIGMSSGPVPDRVDFQFRSLWCRLSFPPSPPRLRLRPPRRPFPILLRWHRAKTPRCLLPSPRPHVGAQARMPSSPESIPRALVRSFRVSSRRRFSVSSHHLPPLGTHVDARARLPLSQEPMRGDA